VTKFWPNNANNQRHNSDNSIRNVKRRP